MARTIAALLALAVALPSAAKDVAGVKLDDAVSVGGRELRLNGAGVRKRFLVQVYVGALYLASPSQDADAVVSADAPKRVRMVFLRDVDKGSILGAFRDGFEANSPGEAKELRRTLAEKVASAIPDMKEGGELVVTYAPGEGTTVAATGGRSAKVEGKAFADGLFRNWLGKKPADADLKKAMLGR